MFDIYFSIGLLFFGIGWIGNSAISVKKNSAIAGWASKYAPDIAENCKLKIIIEQVFSLITVICLGVKAFFLFSDLGVEFSTALITSILFTLYGAYSVFFGVAFATIARSVKSRHAGTHISNQGH
jgi:hypothetical protein